MDFRPVFYWQRGWRWRPDDGSRTAFGHTLGHTPADHNVCLMGKRLCPASSEGLRPGTTRRTRSSSGAQHGSRTSPSSSSTAICSTSWSIRTQAVTPDTICRRPARALRVPVPSSGLHTVFPNRIIPSRKATTMKIDADEKELLESVDRGESDWNHVNRYKRLS